jgi:predicted dehydrogenase
MKGKLIVGVIGGGFASHLRCNASKEIDRERLELKGIYDRNTKNKASFANEYGIKSYTNLEDMLSDKEINTIFVCVPSKYHYESIKSALKYDKNVLCEYPFIVDNYKNAEELMKTAKKKNLFIHVGQTMNYDEDKDFILKHKDKLGKLLMGYRYMNFGDLGSWFPDSGYEGIGQWYINREETGGWIVTAHYHGIQMFRKVFGEVKSVSGVDSSLSSIAAASVLLKHEDGASSVVQWGMPLKGKIINITIVSGSTGSIVIDSGNYSIETSDYKEDGQLGETMAAIMNTFKEDFKSLFDELDGKKDMKQENKDMLKVLKVSILADKAAKERKVIEIK